MTIGETIKQGLGYARRLRGLWLFGFFVGLSSGGGGGAGGHQGGHGGGGGGLHFSPAQIGLIIAAFVLLAVGALVMRLISEGALIEGVARDRRGERVRLSQGFKDGLAHAGVLARIFVMFVAVTFISVAAPVVVVALALKLLGVATAVVLGVFAALVGIPWLITLYVLQTFAARIAVLENRQALDAIRRARLFLHGRIAHGLRLIVAGWLGSLVVGFFGFLVILPLVLVGALLFRALHMPVVIVIGCLLALPVIFIGLAMTGTVKSSIWTLGYLEQVEG